ncbi:hypothetical protein A2Y99_02885 [Candidatus Gottesmanbacteria bacterium RBG_13_37_7]|uniref:O-antigen ligase-related domain-containing protein n=1 Tax=Candidatus Gottesmanbacteria bacterium RBG_13_37_7 TaxID=1798369 RepID=A0A1F5YG30_9BACT|nr:MAG: hypothetical protein A2Y99_02885 [Candidatus Gottesmanbacteria bacterium RBG_13_37_7]
MKRSYFFIGLAIFYLIIFFAPNKPVYFGAYFVSTFFFYLSNKNLRTSFLYSLILSIFSEIGLAGSLFLMEPNSLNMGSGWWISPMTLILIIMIPFSFNKQLSRIHTADVFVLLFFIWSIINLIIYSYTNVFLGILTLTECIIAYYLLRIYLSKTDLQIVVVLLLSILLFQSIIGIIQWRAQRPLGITAEPVMIDRSSGFTTVEEENLFRITGTTGHPNILASTLLVLSPFLFISKKNNRLNILFRILVFFALFFTFSRVAWAIFIICFSYYFITYILKKNIGNLLESINLKATGIIITVFVLVFIILSPYLSTRFRSIPLAFEEGGSMNIRLKLYQEALSMIVQFPVFGVGINRSLETYAAYPSSNIMRFIYPSGFYRIHNTFLEIVSETGIVGLIFFMVLLFLVIKKAYIDRHLDFQKASLIGLFSLIGIASFNPFFHFSQFRLFFLLSALILV